MNRFILFSQCVILFTMYQTSMVAGDNLGPTSIEVKNIINQEIAALQAKNPTAAVREEFKVDKITDKEGTAYDHVSFITVLDNANHQLELVLLHVDNSKKLHTIATIDASTIETSNRDVESSTLIMETANNKYEVIFDIVGDITVLENFAETYNTGE